MLKSINSLTFLESFAEFVEFRTQSLDFLPQIIDRRGVRRMLAFGFGTIAFGFGVFDPASEKKTKEALEEFLQTDRVLSMHSPDYRNGGDLGSILRAAVANRCSDIQLERAQPRRKQG